MPPLLYDMRFISRHALYCRLFQIICLKFRDFFADDSDSLLTIFIAHFAENASWRLWYRQLYEKVYGIFTFHIFRQQYSAASPEAFHL